MAPVITLSLGIFKRFNNGSYLEKAQNSNKPAQQDPNPKLVAYNSIYERDEIVLDRPFEKVSGAVAIIKWGASRKIVSIPRFI